jgi:hypothetical protein
MHVLAVGTQVMNWVEAHGHWVVTFVPCFNAENLAAITVV